MTASSYAFAIINNHPFIDGNKRTGFALMNGFLELNNIIIEFPEDETVEMMVKIANHKLDIHFVSDWLKKLVQ